LEVLEARELGSWHREGEDPLKGFRNGVGAWECQSGDSELQREMGGPLTLGLPFPPHNYQAAVPVSIIHFQEPQTLICPLLLLPSLLCSGLLTPLSKFQP